MLLATGSRPRLPDWATVDGRAGALDPRRVPAAAVARPPRRDRLRRHRRRVRAHVQLARERGHPHRLPPAGAPAEGLRGGRRPRGRAAPPRRAPAQGRPRHRASTSPTAAWSVRCDDGRTAPGQPRAARHRLGAQQRGPRRSTRPAWRPTTAATCPSTRPAARTCRHIYAAGDLSGKLPLSSVAAMQGRRIAEHVMGVQSRTSRAARLRQGRLGHLHGPGDRRRRPRRGRRLRRGPQGAGHEGAVLGVAQGAHREPQPRLREDRERPGHRRRARRLDRRAATPPS